MPRHEHKWINTTGRHYICECGKDKLVKFPIKGQPEKTLKENYKEKTIIWKNLFMIDSSSIALILIVIFMTTTYNIDTANCKEMIHDPVSYCNKTLSCSYFEERDKGINNIMIPEETTDGFEFKIELP